MQKSPEIRQISGDLFRVSVTYQALAYFIDISCAHREYDVAGARGLA